MMSSTSREVGWLLFFFLFCHYQRMEEKNAPYLGQANVVLDGCFAFVRLDDTI